MKQLIQSIAQDNRKGVLAILSVAILISLIIGIITVAVFYSLFAVLSS